MFPSWSLSFFGLRMSFPQSMSFFPLMQDTTIDPPNNELIFMSYDLHLGMYFREVRLH